MNRKVLTTALGLLTLLTLAGCGAASGREVPIEMTNYKLSPAAVSVRQGEQITFVLTNKSDADHEFESDQGHLEEVLVPAGKERKVNWKAPDKAGDYEFECDMAGHDGMVMTITVTP